MSTLGMKLTRAILEHDPRMLDCNIKAVEETVEIVAKLLGNVMATLLVKDPQGYGPLLLRLFVLVNEECVKTAMLASEMAQDKESVH